MSPVLVGYEHFLEIAARIAWDAEAIDLSADAAHWRSVSPARRERLTAFLAAFTLAEERVALDLEPFIAAASSPGLAACFGAQARDEARHAQFFERYAREVVGGKGLQEGVDPGFAELFEERLRAAAGKLARGRIPLANAVALYHIVLEGLVFSAGQSALLGELRASGDLPGLRGALERIVADERWHIGLGVRVLRGEAGVVRFVIDADRALAAWGDLLEPEQRDAALRQHRRRLAAAGLA